MIRWGNTALMYLFWKGVCIQAETSLCVDTPYQQGWPINLNSTQWPHRYLEYLITPNASSKRMYEHVDMTVKYQG